MNRDTAIGSMPNGKPVTANPGSAPTGQAQSAAKKTDNLLGVSFASLAMDVKKWFSFDDKPVVSPAIAKAAAEAKKLMTPAKSNAASSGSGAGKVQGPSSPVKTTTAPTATSASPAKADFMAIQAALATPGTVVVVSEPAIAAPSKSAAPAPQHVAISIPAEATPAGSVAISIAPNSAAPKASPAKPAAPVVTPIIAPIALTAPTVTPIIATVAPAAPSVSLVSPEAKAHGMALLMHSKHGKASVAPAAKAAAAPAAPKEIFSEAEIANLTEAAKIVRQLLSLLNTSK
jgi:hypothetical protein